MTKRPRVRIRFKYNMETGEIEEFIIDDNAPGANEAYHDGIAKAIASRLGKNPDIEDAGVIREDEFSGQVAVGSGQAAVGSKQEAVR